MAIEEADAIELDPPRMCTDRDTKRPWCSLTTQIVRHSILSLTSTCRFHRSAKLVSPSGMPEHDSKHSVPAQPFPTPMVCSERRQFVSSNFEVDTRHPAGCKTVALISNIQEWRTCLIDVAQLCGSPSSAPSLGAPCQLRKRILSLHLQGCSEKAFSTV